MMSQQNHPVLVAGRDQAFFSAAPRAMGTGQQRACTSTWARHTMSLVWRSKTAEIAVQTEFRVPLSLWLRKRIQARPGPGERTSNSFGDHRSHKTIAFSVPLLGHRAHIASTFLPYILATCTPRQLLPRAPSTAMRMATTRTKNVAPRSSPTCSRTAGSRTWSTAPPRETIGPTWSMG